MSAEDGADLAPARRLTPARVLGIGFGYAGT